MDKKHAVIFLAWGEKYIKEVEVCIRRSKGIQPYDHILITDVQTDVSRLDCKFSEVIRAPFETEGLLRKTEMLKYLPGRYDSFLYLDSDTIVLDDISLGFEKAAKFGIAAAPAPHYSLDWFWGFNSNSRLHR